MSAAKITTELNCFVLGRAVIIPVLDPNPDSELRRFLTFFNSNSNSESSCYIVLVSEAGSESGFGIEAFFDIL